MRPTMNHFTALLAGAVAALASASSMACSLVPVDPLLLKQAMAKEIAYRLGVKVEQIRLDDITAPELQRPFELGADCSGFWSFHHISGFRIKLEPPKFKVKRIGIGNDPSIYTTGGASKRARARAPWPWWFGPGFRGRPRDSPIFAPGTVTSPPDLQAQADYLAGLQGSDTRWSQYPAQAGFNNAAKPSAPAGDPSSRWPQYPQESQYAGQGYAQEEPDRWSDIERNSNEVQRWRFQGHFLRQLPRQKDLCTYEGVAVILGYGESSPVAVNFMNSCDRP